MKKTFVFCFLIFATNLSFASFSNEDAGTRSVGTLRVIPGGEQMALGQTGTSYTTAANALFWNPALLGTDEHGSLFLSHSVQVEGMNQNHMALSIPYRSQTGFGIGVTYADFGSLNQTSDIGAPLDNLNPHDLLVSGGFGFPLGFLRLGVSGKYISSEIRNKASTWASDVALWLPIQRKSTALGLSYQNMGAEIQYDQKKEKLPGVLRIGLHHTLFNKWRLALEGLAPKDQDPTLALGVAYRLLFPSTLQFFLRGGYNHSLAADKQDLAGMTLGVGLKYKRFGFDYAWVPLGELGSTHYLSMDVMSFR